MSSIEHEIAEKVAQRGAFGSCKKKSRIVNRDFGAAEPLAEKVAREGKRRSTKDQHGRRNI